MGSTSIGVHPSSLFCTFLNRFSQSLHVILFKENDVPHCAWIGLVIFAPVIEVFLLVVWNKSLKRYRRKKNTLKRLNIFADSRKKS